MVNGLTLAEVPPPFCAGRLREGMMLDSTSLSPAFPVCVSCAPLKMSIGTGLLATVRGWLPRTPVTTTASTAVAAEAGEASAAASVASLARAGDQQRAAVAAPTIKPKMRNRS